MKLELVRNYHPTGTNSELFLDDKPLCFAIELPWKENQPKVSCIPEGVYRLTKRYSLRYGWHLLVNDVPDRSLILLHAYNDAATQSKGCIAPVSSLTGHGKGAGSRIALQRLTMQVYPLLQQGAPVFLTIRANELPG